MVIQRRFVLAGLLAAPAVVKAEGLMPVVAPPTWAIPATNGPYPWERVTEARMQGWEAYRRDRGYGRGDGQLGHSQQASRLWRKGMWHSGRYTGGFAPVPNDAPFRTLWNPDTPGRIRGPILVSYRGLVTRGRRLADGEAWPAVEANVVYTDPAFVLASTKAGASVPGDLMLWNMISGTSSE